MDFVEFCVDPGGMDNNFAALCLTSPFCRAPEMDALAPRCSILFATVWGSIHFASCLQKGTALRHDAAVGCACRATTIWKT